MNVHTHICLDGTVIRFLLKSASIPVLIGKGWEQGAGGEVGSSIARSVSELNCGYA